MLPYISLHADAVTLKLQQIVSDVFPPHVLLKPRTDLFGTTKREDHCGNGEEGQATATDDGVDNAPSATSNVAAQPLSLKERVAQRIAEADRDELRRRRDRKPGAEQGEETSCHNVSSSSEAPSLPDVPLEQVVPSDQRPSSRTPPRGRRRIASPTERAKRCCLCRLGFASLQQLKQHSFFSHPSHVCKHCSRFFVKPDFARCHERTCMRRYPTCPRCGERALSLQEHRCRGTLGGRGLPTVVRVGSHYRLVSSNQRP
ncbi:uncharacterized protein LOC117653595 [Thrips palmi]|uniref:Uncharacterized protein LOC117653595 n=1 Tax=Thrips palmi TaxID=161013 RepID=A0A6P9AIM8_THRPL|nr:uncharacterized protein LOC117653595 [Thrips palmi]